MGGGASRDLPPIDPSAGDATIRYAGQGVSEVPPELAPYTSLTDLDLSDNALRQVPASLAALAPRLRRLDVSGNTTLGQPHGGAVTNAVLDPTETRSRRHFLSESLADTPWSTGLQSLTADRCAIGSWDDRVASLSGLRLLSMRGNELRTVGEVGASLETLDLSDNCFPLTWEQPGGQAGDGAEAQCSIPSGGGKSHGDVAIDVGGTDGSALRVLTATCRNEKMAKVSATRFPMAVLRFKSLVSLTLQGQGIDTIPDGIDEHLPKLEQLRISHNHIRTFPPTLARWTRLTLLDVSQNDLRRLPDQVAECTSLAHIDARSNPIVEVDAAIGTLRDLAVLRCDWQAVTNIDGDPKGQWPEEGLRRLARLREEDREGKGEESPARGEIPPLPPLRPAVE